MSGKGQCGLGLVLISRKIADIGLRQRDYLKDYCSTPKLFCFSLVIGDFCDLREPGFKLKTLWRHIIKLYSRGWRRTAKFLQWASELVTTGIFSDEKLENLKFLIFWNFPVNLHCNTHEKCITIHVFLVNFRPSFRYSKMQIRITSTSPQLHCVMTYDHCMSCLPHDTLSRSKEQKTSITGRHWLGDFPSSCTPTTPLNSRGSSLNMSPINSLPLTSRNRFWSRGGRK